VTAAARLTIATVLVIDDDDDIRRLVAFNLRAAGFEVLEAATAGEGIALATMHRPRVMIVDRMLPGVDGVALCGLIRADPEIATSGILVLSALGRTSDVRQAMEAGADAYIVKPCAMSDLVARVAGLVEKSVK
jgi:DNA-binding response OmpR family regulator